MDKLVSSLDKAVLVLSHHNVVSGNGVNLATLFKVKLKGKNWKLEGGRDMLKGGKVWYPGWN